MNKIKNYNGAECTLKLCSAFLSQIRFIPHFDTTLLTQMWVFTNATILILSQQLVGMYLETYIFKTGYKLDCCRFSTRLGLAGGSGSIIL